MNGGRAEEAPEGSRKKTRALELADRREDEDDSMVRVTSRFPGNAPWNWQL